MGFIEINTIRKSVKRSTLRVGILYPSYYLVAADSIAYQMLYHYLNLQEDVYAERFVMSQEGHPVVNSLETGTPLNHFDVVFISVHYELDFVNILRFMLNAKIPLRSEERFKPIFVAGGPPVISNPVPLSDFIDVLAVGEIESIIPIFLERHMEEGNDKKRLLDTLDPLQGFFVPSVNNGEPVRLTFPLKLPREFHPAAQFQPLEYPGWRRRTSVETARGCYRGCRFCLEGRIFNVMRERPVEDILSIAREGREYNKSSLVKLVSLSFFDHSNAKRILQSLLEEGFRFSTPSFRAETLDEDGLELVRRGGQRTLVVAPETGSKRIALSIGKYVNMDRVHEVAAAAKKLGFTGLKMYFMVGLPGEAEEDVKESINYVLRVSQASGFRGERALKVTVSPFVPKPHTALQDAPFIGLEVARRRIKLLREGLAGVADVREYDPRLALIQTVIARGNREVGRLLLEWAQLGGGIGSFRKAVLNSGVTVKKYIGHQEPPHPWDFIQLNPRTLWIKST
ncbi:MAG: radical SAM protein [Infirmifilum sp.]